MPTIISDHQVFTPHDVTEVLQFMADHRDESWRPVAGGTDVMVGIYRNRGGGNRWINLAPLRNQLAGIHDDGSWIRIGSLTTMTVLRQSALLNGTCPLIRQAAATVGGVQIQNRATVGGNIMNGSLPGDTLPVWLALDAEVEFTSLRAQRCVPFRQLVTDNRQTAVAPDELLTAVLFRPQGNGSLRLLFRKVAARSAQAVSKVVVAAIAGLDSEGCYRDMRLAFGSMDSVPRRARVVEQRVEGHRPSDALGEKAANQLAHDLAPTDDHHSTAEYRLRVARNLTRAFIAGHIGEQQL